MPFIIARRSDVQNGSVLVTDLFPDQSQANPTVDPKPQGPYYVRKTVFGTEFGSTPRISSNLNIRTLATPAVGVLGYILRRIATVAGSSVNLDAAIRITNAIALKVGAGDPLTAAVLNGIVLGEVGSDFDGSGSASTGEVSELLRILAGESYVIPAGTDIQNALGNLIVVVADTAFGNDNRNLVERDKSWQTSFASGVLSRLVAPTTSIFGVASEGAIDDTPLVTVYNTDGSVYNG